MLIGPAMLVALPMVMSAVLPLLPSVRPLVPESTRKLVIGNVNALENDVPTDSMVTVPVVSTSFVLAKLKLFARNTTGPLCPLAAPRVAELRLMPSLLLPLPPVPTSVKAPAPD